MSRALSRLRRNSPQQTSVYIDLNEEEDDAAIARALEQNQYVSRVLLRLARRNADWDHLYRVLATRGNLEHFSLYDDLLPSNRVPADRIRPILQAIQQNASVRVVEFFRNTWEAEDLCSFLDNAAQITDLTLHSCALQEREQGAREVAAALQRNTNIATLKLNWIDGFLVPILEGLGSNTCVRNLVIEHHDLSEATRNALQGLLESSTGSLQHLELSRTRLTEESFRPIAQGLINGSIATGITLNKCAVTDEGSTRLLNQILERKQNLRSLAVKNCDFSRWMPQFLEALFLALRRPASPLRHFQFDDSYIIDIYHPSNQSLSTLHEAVAVSKLDSFSVGMIDNEQRFTALADIIPSMKIRKLHIKFELGGYFYNDLNRRMKQALRKVFKDNYSLQSVKYQHGDADSFDASDIDETVKFYLERNIRLAQWVENPATVPKHLWKEATTLAAKAGPEALFRLLRKIAPEVLPVRGRKRKRNG